MTRGLGGESPSNVERYLAGVSYPATKGDLLQAAQANDAPRDIMRLIEEIDMEQFGGPQDVMKGYGKPTCRGRGRSPARAAGRGGGVQNRRMPDRDADPLIVAISSRTLFDLEEGHDLFEREGLEAYAHFQRSHENDVLAPGIAFPLVRKLLRLNDGAPPEAPPMRQRPSWWVPARRLGRAQTFAAHLIRFQARHRSSTRFDTSCRCRHRR